MIFYLIFIAFVVYHVVRFLRLLDSPAAPTLSHRGSGFVSKVLKRCPSLTEMYEPPAIWGKCGHVQTAFYGKIGRWNVPLPSGKRFFKQLPSGETISYDIFEPIGEHVTKRDYTILVCPGIANSSEKAYIRTFTDHAMRQGFRVIVLNHIGSLPNVKLTSPKIFTYGDTKYFASMIDTILKIYASSTFLMVGYSMGANIAIKYLGEDIERQKRILCVVSLCQGYDAVRSTEPMKEGFRLIYNKLITANMKKVLRPHWDELFVGDNNNSSLGCYDGSRILSAKSLYDIEDGLLRHFDGHASVHEYMDKASCSHVIHNVKIPTLLVNSEDDPVVVNDVHDVPEDFCSKNPLGIFARFKHGGHLGFYTGSWYKPDSTSLVERIITEYLNAVIDIQSEMN